MAALNKMTLDFRRDMSRWRNSGTWLLIFGVCAATAVGMGYTETKRQLVQSRHDASSLLQADAPPVAEQSDSDKTQLAAEIKHAAGIVQQLSLDWNQLFRAVQLSAGAQVALLSIQPDAVKQVIRITGEARDMDAMLEYVTRLRRQHALAQVILTNHEIKAQDPDKPVQFSISAKWMIAR